MADRDRPIWVTDEDDAPFGSRSSLTLPDHEGGVDHADFAAPHPASRPHRRPHRRHICDETCDRLADLLDDLADRRTAATDDIAASRRFAAVIDAAREITSSELWPTLLADASPWDDLADPADPVGVLDQTVDADQLAALAEEVGPVARAVTACGGVAAAAVALAAWWDEFGAAATWQERGEAADEEWEWVQLATCVGLDAWSAAGRPGRLALLTARVVGLSALIRVVAVLRSLVAAACRTTRGPPTTGTSATRRPAAGSSRAPRRHRRPLTCRRSTSRGEAGHAGAPPPASAGRLII